MGNRILVVRRLMQTFLISIIAVAIAAILLTFRKEIGEATGAVGDAVEQASAYAGATIRAVDDTIDVVINDVIYHPEENQEAINLLIQNGVTAEKWIVWHQAAKAGYLVGWIGHLFDEKTDGIGFFSDKMKIVAGLGRWDALHSWLYDQVYIIAHYEEPEPETEE